MVSRFDLSSSTNLLRTRQVTLDAPGWNASCPCEARNLVIRRISLKHNMRHKPQARDLFVTLECNAHVIVVKVQEVIQAMTTNDYS